MVAEAAMATAVAPTEQGALTREELLQRWDRVLRDPMMTVLSNDPDLEELLIDATIVRAHQHAAGAQKKPVHKPSGARGEG
jgi:hypothetical protein